MDFTSTSTVDHTTQEAMAHNHLAPPPADWVSPKKKKQQDLRTDLCTAVRERDPDKIRTSKTCLEEFYSKDCGYSVAITTHLVARDYTAIVKALLNQDDNKPHRPEHKQAGPLGYGLLTPPKPKAPKL